MENVITTTPTTRTTLVVLGDSFPSPIFIVLHCICSKPAIFLLWCHHCILCQQWWFV